LLPLGTNVNPHRGKYIYLWYVSLVGGDSLVDLSSTILTGLIPNGNFNNGTFEHLEGNIYKVQLETTCYFNENHSYKLVPYVNAYTPAGVKCIKCYPWNSRKY